MFKSRKAIYIGVLFWGVCNLTYGLDINTFSQSRFYSSFLLSMNNMHLGKKQNVLLQNNFFNKYVPTSNTKYVPGIDIDAGFQFSLKHDFLLKTGIGLGYISDIRNSGDVYEYGSPDFNNLKYSYRLNSTHLMFVATILRKFSPYLFRFSIYPYVNIGLGAAINKVKSYKETPKYSNVLAMAPFTNNTTLNRAYQAGFGIDFQYSRHVFWGVGYRFIDLGHGKFDASPAQNTTDRFETKSLHDNSFGFHLTYMA